MADRNCIIWLRVNFIKGLGVGEFWIFRQLPDRRKFIRGFWHVEKRGGGCKNMSGFSRVSAQN